jgi:integrase
MPLRVIYRRALEDGDVAINPCLGLRLPAVRGRRDRIATPTEAATLLGVLAPRDQALWGTALYAGLRLGELRALRWEDIDLNMGLIHVRRSMDASGAEIAPKSTAGTRTIPIISALRPLLAAHKLATKSEGLVFGTTPTHPFTPSAVNRRARTAWKHGNITAIGLHECRHSYASILIASGINAKAISVYLGHSSIQTTYDLYGKLMPGNEAEAAIRVDEYLIHAQQRG